MTPEWNTRKFGSGHPKWAELFWRRFGEFNSQMARHHLVGALVGKRITEARTSIDYKTITLTTEDGKVVRFSTAGYPVICVNYTG